MNHPAQTPAIELADSQIFREAMSRLGAAVHIVTTDGKSGKAGFTATAVASVSDAPSTLLVCLNRKSQITPLMLENGSFCVNTLAASEETIADVFAGRTGIFMAERFKTGNWDTIKTGSPALKSAIATFDCRVLEAKEVGSHFVYFGSVVAVRLGPAAKALVYHDRAYKHV
ncbi:MAG: flavin reductase [Pseudorhodoplanes sp.]|jgi:flavin reductase|nr:flavin reductase [Pseudorhodoplanes sp.]